MPRSQVPPCVVCGASDARALDTVTLRGGAHVVLCGTHALVYRRSGTPAGSEAELRTTVGERRSRGDRRGAGDELGVALTEAFRVETRRADRRS